MDRTCIRRLTVAGIKVCHNQVIIYINVVLSDARSKRNKKSSKSKKALASSMGADIGYQGPNYFFKFSSIERQQEKILEVHTGISIDTVNLAGKQTYCQDLILIISPWF